MHAVDDVLYWSDGSPLRTGSKYLVRNMRHAYLALLPHMAQSLPQIRHAVL